MNPTRLKSVPPLIPAPQSRPSQRTVRVRRAPLGGVVFGRATACRPQRSLRAIALGITLLGFLALTQASLAQQWRQVKVTGTMRADTCWLYIYTANTTAPLYIDDVSMCLGSIAETGPNLVANSGFESGLSGWESVADFIGSSAATTTQRRSGNYSLHLASAVPVASGGSGNSVKQDVQGLISNQVHTLSFWYLATNALSFTARYSGHSEMRIDVAMGPEGSAAAELGMSQLDTASLRLSWMARTGILYRVMNRASLSTGVWEQVNLINPVSTNASVDLSMADPRRFFSLVEATFNAPAVDNIPGATSIGTNSATLNGTLSSTGSLPTKVSICWDSSDKGTTSPGNWANVVPLGFRPVGPFSTVVSGFGTNQILYYRAYASNSMGAVFASPVTNFIRSSPPVITNTGASPVGMDSATLNGVLLSTGRLPTRVWICWDSSDKGTGSPANWTHVEALGSKATGLVSVVASSFGSDSTFYYRCFASNAVGGVFATPVSTFTRSNAPAQLSARISQLEQESFLVNYSNQFTATYALETNMLSLAEVAKMQNDYQVYYEELVLLNPTNADYHIELGNHYVNLGAGTNAASQFTLAKNLPGLTSKQQGDIFYGLASSALLNGNRASAIDWCEQALASNLPSYSVGGRAVYPDVLAKFALKFMKGPQLNDLRLPFYTAARAFPLPQQVDYSGNFVDLSSVKLILGGGLNSNDVRVVLLTNKLGRLGIAFSDAAPFSIKINTESTPTAPAKSEGYALFVTNNAAVINSYDAQGTLWGIVSLIQVIDDEFTPKIRICSMVDWPDVARRGFLQDNWKDTLEFMLFCKLNTVVDQRGGPFVVPYPDPARPLTPLQKAINADRSSQFTAFGLDFYYGIRPWTMQYHFPLSSERTLALHTEICSEIARNGGHIYFPFDDSRYPFHPDDAAIWATSANLDARYVDWLYEAVHDEVPTFKMVFCPPFYAGPGEDASYAYNESRDDYLRSIQYYLDPAVDVFWTGPYVKGWTKTASELAWLTNLTHRAPMIFQNVTGPHNSVSYITDETDHWTSWHYEGFFTNDITGYLKNAHMGTEAPQTTTLADCLWNLDGYDASNSIRNGVAMLFGRDFFGLLDPLTQALGYLDKYEYGTITPEALTETNEITVRAQIAAAAFADAEAYNAFSLSNFPGWCKSAVGWYSNMVVGLQSPPNFHLTYTNEIATTKSYAQSEAGLNTASGDIFLSPVDLLGGEMGNYDGRFSSRLYGAKTALPRLKSSFVCTPYPPSSNYFIKVSARDDVDLYSNAVDIRISVNGTPIYQGPNTFQTNNWSIQSYTIPMGILSSTNELKIENIEDTDYPHGPPRFSVNYAVVSKSQ